MKVLPLLLAVVLCGCAASEKQVAASAPTNPEAAYMAAKQRASAGDAERAAFVNATVAYGTFVMNGDGVPSVKYPKALALYEEALKLDPTNKEAKQNRDMILSIYESLGKKPPKN